MLSFIDYQTSIALLISITGVFINKYSEKLQVQETPLLPIYQPPTLKDLVVDTTHIDVVVHKS